MLNAIMHVETDSTYMCICVFHLFFSLYSRLLKIGPLCQPSEPPFCWSGYPCLDSGDVTLSAAPGEVLFAQSQWLSTRSEFVSFPTPPPAPGVIWQPLDTFLIVVTGGRGGVLLAFRR